MWESDATEAENACAHTNTHRQNQIPFNKLHLLCRTAEQIGCMKYAGKYFGFVSNGHEDSIAWLILLAYEFSSTNRLTFFLELLPEIHIEKWRCAHFTDLSNRAMFAMKVNDCFMNVTKWNDISQNEMLQPWNFKLGLWKIRISVLLLLACCSLRAKENDGNWIHLKC